MTTATPAPPGGPRTVTEFTSATLEARAHPPYAAHPQIGPCREKPHDRQDPPGSGDRRAAAVPARGRRPGAVPRAQQPEQGPGAGRIAQEEEGQGLRAGPDLPE